MNIIEPLESRIAPAAIFVTYTDLDGDSVKITATKAGAAVAPLDATDLTFVGGGAAGQLATLNLTEPAFDGASISVSVVKAGAGDGLAAIGRINGGTNDFGAIAIKGDLGKIDAGSNNTGTPAIKSLSVRTLGLYGLATQGGAGDLRSEIHGALGALKVAGDVKDVLISVSGGISATLGSVSIGGSLVGGITPNGGTIFSTGDMGAVKIGHDIRGGLGGFSGSIRTEVGRIASVTIGGSLVGGTFNESGVIRSGGDMGVVNIGRDVRGGGAGSAGGIICLGRLAGATIGGSLIGSGLDGGGSFNGGGFILGSRDMGPVKIGRDVRGGSGASSGVISSQAGGIASVTIGGSLIGGVGTSSGSISSAGDIGLVKIGRDVLGGEGSSSGGIDSGGKLAGVTLGGSLRGGTGSNTGGIASRGDMGAVTIAGDLTGASISTGSLSASGGIVSLARIASVTIGGSIVAGADNSAGGSLSSNAFIRAQNDIGSITVKGSLIGSVGTGGDITKVVISARGQATPAALSDVAFGKVSIGGRVERAQILAGYDVSLTPTNGNAQIGAVAVGGDWIASDLIAGVADLGAVGFGDASDAIIGFGASIAKIASITIKGVVVGTAAGGDRFGFESHSIGSFKAGGVAIQIPAAPGSVGFSPITTDVTLRLV